jgi:hypothetical protein
LPSSLITHHPSPITHHASPLPPTITITITHHPSPINIIVTITITITITITVNITITVIFTHPTFTSIFTHFQPQATDNFNDELLLGDGGSCSVYRGMIRGQWCAIKVMVPSSNGGGDGAGAGSDDTMYITRGATRIQSSSRRSGSR